MKSGSLSRFLKSASRKEPVSGFVLLVGIVDVVIGGAGGHWSLLAVGLGTVGVAIAVRWWKIQTSRIEVTERAPIHYLPSRSSSPSLPLLQMSRKRPPNG